MSTSDGANLAEFNQQRQALLSQRMRAARVTGAAPQWRCAESDAKSTRATVVNSAEPATLASVPGIPSVGSAPHAPPAQRAPAGDGVATCALAVGAVAVVVLVVYVVKMLMHDEKYGYAA